MTEYFKCCSCNEQKHKSDYHKDKTRKEGISYSCKACSKERAKKYRNNNLSKVNECYKKWSKANAEKIKDYSLKYREKNKEKHSAYKRYILTGFTEEDINRKLIEQNNKCAICGIDFTSIKKRHIHADHCHTTLKKRGLLCHYCNVGIGSLRDSIEILNNAIQYLKKYD